MDNRKWNYKKAGKRIFSFLISWSSGKWINWTLRRRCREPCCIRTIVINTKVPLSPMVVLQLGRGELPSRRLIPPVEGGGGQTSRRRVLPQAAAHVVIRVGRNEWGVGPVRFDLAALSGPWVSVPDAPKQVHCLCVGEEVVGVICVLVYPYRNFIHKEPVLICQVIQWRISKR